MNNRLMYSPVGLLVVVSMLFLLWLAVILLFLGAFSTAFTRVGFTWEHALLLLLASLLGSGMNLPVTVLESRVPVVSKAMVRRFGMVYRVPVVQTVTNQTILAVNLGGAIIPVTVSAYLLLQFPETVPYAAVGVLVVTLATHAVARPVEGLGIATPILVPPLAAALAAILLTTIVCPADIDCRFIIAYVGGVLGALMGADILNLGKIADLGAPVASIGGAGTFDGIFLTGVIAVLLV